MDAPAAADAELSPRDTQVAAVMFGVACCSLFWLGGVLHLTPQDAGRAAFWFCVFGSLAVYPLYWIEAIWLTRRRSPAARMAWWCCLLPPLRLARRDPVTATRIWLPGWDWQVADAALRQRVERALHLPMLIVALLVLPVIIVEYAWKSRLESDPQLARITELATALIWCAFTAEFVLQLSLTPKKLEYIKQHWLDLAIILLPLLAFLRTLQLGRLLRLHQLSGATRVYKLRGVSMKAFKALMLLNVIQRALQGPPEKRLPKLREQLAIKEQELTELRREIEQLEVKVAQSAEAVEAA